MIDNTAQNNSEPRTARTVLAIGATCMPLLCAGMVGVYLKFSLMERYWNGIARLADQSLVPRLSAASYFAADILVNFLFIPLLITTFAMLIFRKLAPIATTAASCVLIVFYFIQLRAQDNVGQYLSATMMLEALQFAIAEPDVASSYLSIGALTKLFLALFMTVVCTLYLVQACKRTRISKYLVFGIHLVAGTLLVLVGGAIILYPQSAVGLHRSALDQVRVAIASGFSPPNMPQSSLEENIATFRALTGTPKSNGETTFSGKEKGSNILYFIMETGPADVFPGADATELLPPKLVQNTLIGSRHFTTYPYTSDALFSIFSGFYPGGRKETVAKGGFRRHVPVLAALREMGYRTGAYVQGITDEHVDDKMLRQFGVGTVFVSNRQSEDSPERKRAIDAAAKMGASILRSSPHFESSKEAYLLSLLGNDLLALEKLKSEIRTTLHKKGKFAYIFLPQIGHGPWLKAGPVANTRAHGRFWMQVQSDWLTELVKLLAEEGALGNTVIVFTADHGVRTKIEDSDYKVGTIDSYSFHVPLFVYAPQAFAQPIKIRNATSHIDIESSIAELLGLQGRVGASQGIPLWEAPSDRRIYFFAESYGGADGFLHGDYYMNNVITESQFQSREMNFSSPSLRLTAPDKRTFVEKQLADFKKNHRAIIGAL